VGYKGSKRGTQRAAAAANGKAISEVNTGSKLKQEESTTNEVKARKNQAYRGNQTTSNTVIKL